MGEPIRIRLPRLVRLYVVAFSVVWCGMAGSGLAAALARGSPVVIIAIFMLISEAVLAFRLFRLAVISEQGSLVVRNVWRSRGLPRADVEGFRVGAGPMGQPFMKCLYALLKDETLVSLDVTARPMFIPKSMQRLDRHLQALRTWLDQG